MRGWSTASRREMGPGGQEGNGGSGKRKPNLSSHLPDSCRSLFILSESKGKQGGPMHSIWVSQRGREQAREEQKVALEGRQMETVQHRQMWTAAWHE